MQLAALRNTFVFDLWFYESGSGSGNMEIVLEDLPTGTGPTRCVGVYTLCNPTSYTVSTEIPSCVATLAARSAGWHHLTVSIDRTASTARYCVDAACHTEASFAFPVDEFWINGGGLDVYIDDVTITALP